MFKLSADLNSEHLSKPFYEDQPERITQDHQRRAEAYRAKVDVWCEQLPDALKLRKSILVGLTEDQLQALPAVFQWLNDRRVTSFGDSDYFGFKI